MYTYVYVHTFHFLYICIHMYTYTHFTSNTYVCLIFKVFQQSPVFDDKRNGCSIYGIDNCLFMSRFRVARLDILWLHWAMNRWKIFITVTSRSLSLTTGVPQISMLFSLCFCKLLWTSFSNLFNFDRKMLISSRSFLIILSLICNHYLLLRSCHLSSLWYVIIIYC